MTPLDFIKPGDVDFNDPVGDWAEAMGKGINIRSKNANWVVVSYYLLNREMVLEIEKVKTDVA